MFYLFMKNKNWESWSKAEQQDIDDLILFFKKTEHAAVPFTSRIIDKSGFIDFSLITKNNVFLERNNGKICSTIMLSPEGIICPVFTEASNPGPISEIIKNTAYSKKRYMTLMGRSDDLNIIEQMFKNFSRVSIDYNLLIANSEKIPLQVNAYLEKKNPQFLERFTIYRADLNNLDRLMPLREAYELEEVLFNPDYFNKQACRKRFSNTIVTNSVFFASENGRPAATSCINACGIKWAQIGGVYTVPKYRSQGLSAILMSAIAKETVEKDLNLTLFVKKNNLPANKLYANCGFRDVGDFRISYLEKR